VSSSEEDRRLAGDLVLASAKLVRQVRAAVPGDLSMAQSRVLALLRDAGAPLRVSQLTERERCAQPTMTALVSRLEAAGYVSRQADARDRRAVRVALTPAGLDALAEVGDATAAVLAPRLARLDDAGRRTLRDAAALLDHLTREDLQQIQGAT
jgi:DNA-binding MarR family transcriptional regulator